jgi:PD-(D/E)XK endonuclease
MHMKNKGMNIKHAKQRGEWAEMRFMARAAEHGLQVSKPWGESASYDFVVEHGTRCVRVQVKSTMHQRHAGLSCQVRNSRQRPYAEDSFDFAAVYLIPLDVWYIIPTAQVGGQTTIFFSPELKNSKYGQYKEAWHLLRGSPHGGTVDRIEACAAEVQGVTLAEAWL